MTQSDIINNNFSKAFECIKCSNAYDTGAVLSEEKLFKQISERKHSTFDLSKFGVVGSPTITDDGITSGFSGSNYIQVPYLLLGQNFKIFTPKFNSSDVSQTQTIVRYSDGNIRIEIYQNKIRLYRYSTENDYDLPTGQTTLQNNTNYYYYVEQTTNGADYYLKGYISTDNKNWVLDIDRTYTSAMYDFQNNAPIQISGFDALQPFIGTLDPKQFSITVDGKEVFNGNKTGIDVINGIEIPYTLSKTGSKIVDVAYRDRVIDLYEQQGKAGYYTIDEENKNFTLPMGEIYGMIGQSGGSGSGLEICDIGMALYVDETKGLRRYLNGQIVDINTNTQAFLNRLKEITTLHPSLLCTEEEWQTAKTMSVFGQVGKFVFNYSGNEIVSVRIPRVVNIQGLFDLQNLGMTVGAGLPTHTHTRGTMEISGSFPAGRDGWGASGAFSQTSWVGTYGGGKYKLGMFDFYASRSWTGSTSAPDNSVYGASNTVQQEAIQYPYFIQIATGSETENNIINEIELNNPYSLFDSKYSDHELNNLSWLKSEGQWNAKAVYPDAYNELLTEYNNSASSEEIEGSITFKRTPKGYKIALADQETVIDTKYTTYGIAWYYILDTTNEKFKLPRTKFGFEGLRKSVGDDITESLPNIKGSIGGLCANGASGTGAFSNAYGVSNMGFGGNVVTTYGTNFDASRSSSTYQDNAPVQERGTQMYLYFYVGETVQNANLIDAGRIGEQLANKQDKLSRYPIEISDKSLMPSWYVVYNDGWCEQGGYIDSGVSIVTNGVVVTFLKPFLDSNYTITMLSSHNDNTTNNVSVQYGNYYYGCYQSSSKTANTIRLCGNGTWHACGYIS